MREQKKIINQLCNASIDDFCQQYEHIETPNGPLLHIDNGGDVLAVAHLDTVMRSRPKWQGTKIKCPQLDDRLGVWVLLHLLPTLTDIPYDILLTDSEESGLSTSFHFESEKQYNWIFEFDRTGSDCVLYEYYDKKTNDLVKKSGWKVGEGAFTDICSLEHLSIKGFNFGTGYYNQHTKDCFANIRATVKNTKKFVHFLDKHHSTLLPHTPQYNTPSSSAWTEYIKPEDIKSLDCDYCYQQIDPEWTFCPWCGTDVINYDSKNQSQGVQL